MIFGMQTTRYLHAYNPEKTPNFKLLERIRKKHEEYSDKLIRESITMSPGEIYYFGLNSIENLVEFIAIVAKHHRKHSIESLSEPELAGNSIRLPLLSALLRLGDCLDLDYRRVNVDLLLTADIPVKSKLCWYRHYYYV